MPSIEAGSACRDLAIEVGSINILPPDPDPDARESDRAEDRSPQLQWPWPLGEVSAPRQGSKPVSVTLKPAPPCIHSFVRAVARVPGVKCVIVEEEEQNTVHVTTFAAPLTDDVRERV